MSPPLTSFFKPVGTSSTNGKRAREDDREASSAKKTLQSVGVHSITANAAVSPDNSAVLSPGQLRTLANTNAALVLSNIASHGKGTAAGGGAAGGVPLRVLVTEPSWDALLARETAASYWGPLERFLWSEWATQVVYPPQQHTFRALNSLPAHQVRVVILGQDPYHGPGQAEGWAFSVPLGQKVPSSLQNVYKELRDDVGVTPPRHGHLEHWASQGVLLLNTSLSVQAAKANSHSKKGWEKFTDAVIGHLSAERSDIVFMLWGKHAQDRSAKIDAKKHLLLKSAHPSGLSAHRGFFGCRHFSQCNEHLAARGLPAVDWQVPP